MSAHHSHHHIDTATAVKRYVRNGLLDAQDTLLHEYRRPGGPRWTLVQWLKRHRTHNPTTRVIRNAA